MMNQYSGMMNSGYQPNVPYPLREQHCYCPPIYKSRNAHTRQQAQPWVNYSVADWLEDERKKRKDPNWQPYIYYLLKLDNIGLTSLNGLDQIQGLEETKALDLSHNNLKKIKAGAFQRLRFLKTLWLGYNNLTEIEAGAFQGLENLRELWIGFNNLTEIDAGTFQGLGNLHSLDLHHNHRIKIKAGTFQELRNLRELWLNYNNPIEIEAGAFQGLENLIFLNLMNNRIYELPWDIFSDINNLKEIDVRYNYLPGDEETFRYTYLLDQNVRIHFKPQNQRPYLPPKVIVD